MLTREKNKITYLHFILSIVVILIHSINDPTTYQNIFAIDSGIGQFAVPLFFMLSGFLFFRNVHTIQDVTKKIGKRIYTVFYPFLIWNIIYYIVTLLVKGGRPFSIAELFDVALNYTYNPAFWFMFQLILLIAITPILFHVTRKYISYFIFFIVMSALIIFSIDIPYINEDAIIYFSFGAITSKLYGESKIYLIEKKNIIFTLFIAIFFFLMNRIVFSMCNNDMRFVPLFTLTVIYVRLSMGVFIFYLVDLFFSYNKVPKFMNNTFFLYAIHYMIVKGLIVLMQFFIYGFVAPEYWDIIKYFTFIVSPIICVVLSYFLSKLLMKVMPKVYSFITGGRL